MMSQASLRAVGSMPEEGSSKRTIFAFPRSAIRFSSFEFFSKQFQNKNSNSTQIMCGAFSGLIESVTCLTPQNNASVKLSQLKMSNTNLNAGFFQSMKICYKKVGFQGFVFSFSALVCPHPGGETS